MTQVEEVSVEPGDMPPPPAIKPNETKVSNVPQVEEEIDFNKGATENALVSNADENSNASDEDGDNTSKITDPEAKESSEVSSEDTINRDFQAGKRFRELNNAVRNKNSKIQRLENIKSKYKDDKMEWDAKSKLMKKDL